MNTNENGKHNHDQADADITAYALDQLTGSQADDVRKRLSNDADLQEAVNETSRLAGLVEHVNSIGLPTGIAGLEQQMEEAFEVASSGDASPSRELVNTAKSGSTNFWSGRRILAVAATTLAVAGGSYLLITSERPREVAKTPVPEQTAPLFVQARESAKSEGAEEAVQGPEEFPDVEAPELKEALNAVTESLSTVNSGLEAVTQADTASLDFDWLTTPPTNQPIQDPAIPANLDIPLTQGSFGETTPDLGGAGNNLQQGQQQGSDSQSKQRPYYSMKGRLSGAEQEGPAGGKYDSTENEGDQVLPGEKGFVGNVQPTGAPPQNLEMIASGDLDPQTLKLLLDSTQKQILVAEDQVVQNSPQSQGIPLQSASSYAPDPTAIAGTNLNLGDRPIGFRPEITKFTPTYEAKRRGMRLAKGGEKRGGQKVEFEIADESIKYGYKNVDRFDFQGSRTVRKDGDKSLDDILSPIIAKGNVGLRELNGAFADELEIKNTVTGPDDPVALLQAHRDLQVERDTHVATRDELITQLGKSHPKVKELDETIQYFETKLNNESQKLQKRAILQQAIDVVKSIDQSGSPVLFRNNIEALQQIRGELAKVVNSESDPAISAIDREIKRCVVRLAMHARDVDRRTNEQYERLPENQFQRPVGDLAKSTFAIDVDTASYSNARRFINGRQLPPPSSVRVEEFVNYFAYDYAPPTDGKPFAVNMEVASCPWNESHKLLRVGIKGKEVAQDDRPPSNLVFLIDVSGSMSDQNKLPLLQRSMLMLVDKLTENDRVTIVTYAGDAGLRLEPTSGDQKDKIRGIIHGLTSGGSTHGSAGIRMAYDMAWKNFLSEGTNRVILATDGDLNVGVTADDDLVRLIKDKAELGVFLSVLGFGTGNLKDAKLEKLADNGNGQYSYIDSIREARKVLVEEMTGSLITIAKDVKIQVEFNPAEIAGYRLIGYENRALRNQDFDNDRIDAGDIGAGHTVTAIYELIPVGSDDVSAKPETDTALKYQQPAVIAEVADETKQEFELTEAARSGELMTLALRYKEPLANESTRVDFVIKDSDTTFDEASQDFRFAASVASYGMLLRHSRHAGTWKLTEVENAAANALGEDANGHRAEFVDLVRQTRAIVGH